MTLYRLWLLFIVLGLPFTGCVSFQMGHDPQAQIFGRQAMHEEQSNVFGKRERFFGVGFQPLSKHR